MDLFSRRGRRLLWVSLAVLSSALATGCVTRGDLQDSHHALARRVSEEIERMLATIREELRAMTGAMEKVVRDGRAEPSPTLKTHADEVSNILNTLKSLIKELGERRNGGRAAIRSVGEVKVTKLAANRFRVSRRQIETAGTNMGRLVANLEGEVVATRSGREGGLRIVRDDPFAERIGIRRGDVLERVNGIPVAAVAQAHRIAPSLKKSSNVRFDVVRNGSRLQIEIVVVD